MAPYVLELTGDDAGLRRVVESFYHAAPRSDRPPTHQYRIERGPRDGGRWLGVAPGQPLYGPADAGEVFAFLEWRATDDLLHGEQSRRSGEAFLHAAGVALPGGPVMLIGAPGSGKSTLAAHLCARGHRVWGDDLVRFAAKRLEYSAVPRSFKLDSKSLGDIDLLRQLCEQAVPGTLLAPDTWYVSPAAVRTSWEAPSGRPRALVILDSAEHHGPVRLVPMSAAEAAVRVTQTLLGGTGGIDARLSLRVLESLAAVEAYRGGGAGAAHLARAIEELAA